MRHVKVRYESFADKISETHFRLIRRVKCDEQQPCRNCVRHNAECSLLRAPRSMVPLAIAPRISNLPLKSLSATSSLSPDVLALRQSTAPPQSLRGPPGPSSSLSRLCIISNLVQELTIEVQNQAPRLHAQVAPEGNLVDSSPDWMTNLKLLNHYYASTCLTLHHDSATLHLWRVDVPGLAVSHVGILHSSFAQMVDLLAGLLGSPHAWLACHLSPSLCSHPP